MIASRPAPRFTLALLALLVATHARADAAAEAKRLSQRAAAAYKEGQYRDAAETWEKAQALKSSYVVALEVAEAWRLAGEPEKALDAYRRFLADAPPRNPKRAEAQT